MNQYFPKAHEKWKAQIGNYGLGFLLILLFSGPQTSFASLPVSDEVYSGYQLVQDWDITAAEKLSHQLLTKYPNSGDAHFLQARIEFMKGNY